MQDAPIPSFPSIKINNVAYRERAQPLIDALEGQTYMKLRVELCPVGGSFDVNVTTRRADTSEKELTEMVLMVLSSEVCHIYSRRPTVREVAT